jgi:hypothetical protein
VYADGQGGGGSVGIEYHKKHYKKIFSKNKNIFKKVYKNACNMFLYVL